MTKPKPPTDLDEAHRLCRHLALSGLAASLETLCVTANEQRSTHARFLADSLGLEADIRAERKRQRRVHEAKLPRLKTFAEFDTTANPNIGPTTIGLLQQGDFITQARPVVFLGDSGTGKTHLLLATVLAAAETGRRARYVTCAQLGNELAEAAASHQLGRVVNRYARYDLLAVDEVGYVNLDRQSAEHIFQILTEREEKASIAIASNAPFSEWNQTFTDPRLAAAIVDRVTYKAHIIETGTASYRLAQTIR